VVAREARDHRSSIAPDFPTAAAVAEGTHAAWYLIRDACRRRENCAVRDSGGLALRARPPATVRDAIRRRV